MSGHDRARRTRLTAELIGWLATPDPRRIAASVAGWDAATGRLVQQILFSQGLGPYVREVLSQLSVEPTLPPLLRDWLEAEHAANAARAERMHGELDLLLASADRLGIAVMPLKGSVLSVRHYAALALRPMADLDILVKPEDERGMAEVLTGLGYRLAPGYRQKFQRPAERVASWELDHPDNPRPVELHTELRRPLRLRNESPDFAPYLWSQSRESDYLGGRAHLPSDEALLADLARHATGHLLERAGRVLQWLDLAQVAPRVKDFSPPAPDWVYPSLCLAARAFPSHFAGFPLETLAERTKPRVRRLAETVPLDERAGLNVSRRPFSALNPWRRRWFYWRPTSWRVTMSLPDLPPAIAYPVYLGSVGLRALPRLIKRR